MIVKICGITNREDALAAAEGGATAIGFNFYPCSPRYIHPDQAAAIAQSLPASVLRVGVFVNELPREVQRVSKMVPLDVVQLHGDEPAEQAAHNGRHVWKAFRVNRDWDPAVLNEYPADAFLLDGPSAGVYGGSGDSFDWARAQGLTQRIIVAGGLDASNVGKAIREIRPWGRPPENEELPRGSPR